MCIVLYLIGSGDHSDEVWCFDGFVLLLPLTVQQLTIKRGRHNHGTITHSCYNISHLLCIAE